MASQLKKLVSKKKRRFQEDGFDLDMTFITKNIVAMGFPAEKMEGVYRNNMKDVKRFFDQRHRDHYKIYNLCSERFYDPDKFYGRVARYPFDDHNAPPFVLMKPFCEDVAAYLAEDEKNVCVIHCKAGKGRTGVMICAYLLHCKMWEDTKDALDYYGHARTSNGKGVTIPSQVRYVHYYGRLLREKLEYKSRPLILKSVRLIGIPNFSNGTCVPQFTVRKGPEKVVIYKSQFYEGIQKEQKEALLPLAQPCMVCEDIKVEFIHRKSTGKEKMFHLWFNTFFIDEEEGGLRFRALKPEIDKANKDKKHKIFPKNFAVEFLFEKPADDISARMEGAALSEKPPIRSQDSNVSLDPEFTDSDLTTDDDDDDEDEFKGQPITDV
eukprot:m.202594 g.202594  ORF g.202594 m.202594 type:complete len:380 (-) comp17722_c2_seq1:95-1234(-)